MAGWQDLVTTALLGTDRRPVPTGLPTLWAGTASDDPAETVLAQAARHRAASRAGVRLGSCAAPETAPDPAGEPAPPAAQRQMADCLLAGDVPGVNAWLEDADSQQRALAPEHWPAVAHLAAGSGRVDRPRLARALGERGIWFIGQNPRWARLAATLGAALAKGAE